VLKLSHNLPADAQGHVSARERFSRSRARTLSQFQGWLNTDPDPRSVTHEVERTVKALRQLEAMARAKRGLAIRAGQGS
jgi:hypothetical protein